VRGIVTINRPPEELYRRWRDVTNLPRFMRRLASVQALDDDARRSRWQARGPAGKVIEWEAEIVEDRPSERIAWRSLPGSPVEHAGVVQFERAPGGRGTQVTLELDVTPPGGVIGTTLARMLSALPAHEVQEDLRRFKQWMETGDVVLSEGVVRGVARPGESDARRPTGAVAMGGAR
jgi:uncharacterized membrane protein